jgi:hypothetical protein
MGLIGIAGQFSAGKDVFANVLIDELNVLVYKKFLSQLGFEKLYLDAGNSLWYKAAFGDGVKEILQNAFGWDRDFIDEWKRKEEKPEGYLMTVRQALQFIGDGFLQIKPSVWIDLVLNTETSKVVSDVRYVNEAKIIKEKGGCNVLLWRPGFENDINHPSEMQLKPYLEMCIAAGKEGATEGEASSLFDLFIVNSGTIDELREKIKTVVVPFLLSKGVQND